MGICLSHESALRYWLTKQSDEAIPDAARTRTLLEMGASMAEIKETSLPLEATKERPLHVLIPSRQAYRNLACVRTHVWSGVVPRGGLRALSGRNCVSSPEFTFLQMASRLSLQELVEVGCHLCGTFVIGDEGRGYAGRREPLTSVEEIASLIEGAPGAYGVARARRALSYVVPFAASPMEVLFAMAFKLPPSEGGWLMPEIVANQRIAVDERLQVLAGARHLVGDIYLPSVRGDVEYDSEEFHTGKFRLDHTQARRNVLEAMGVKTVSATWGQINTFEKFETFVWMTKERFGIDDQAFTRAERNAQAQLYEHMTSPQARLF